MAKIAVERGRGHMRDVDSTCFVYFIPIQNEYERKREGGYTRPPVG